MPYCQLKRLSRLIRALPPPLGYTETSDIIPSVNTKQLGGSSDCHFWMDTLCVPVSEELQVLRDKAIWRMRDVYSLASNVLVLDAELIKSSAERPFEEIFTRIYCSTWIRRLWTLQEAILNKDLFYQFAERAICVDVSSPLSRAQLREVDQNPWNLVAWQCQGTTDVLDFSHLQTDTNIDIMVQISRLWDSFAYRSTSRVGDEPLCISILHNLDIKEFLKEPYAGTVRKFWSLLRVKGFPTYVLFIPGPKLSDEGYGWAPASLLDLNFTGTDFTRAELTSRGLLVTYPGMVLGQPQHPTRSVIPCSVEGDTYYIRKVLMNNNPSWSRLELGKYTNLALIINPMWGFCATNAGGKYGVEAAIGALVDTIEEGEIRYVKYLRFVALVRKGSYSEQNTNNPWTPVGNEEKTRDPIEGRFLPLTQRWCVG